jgi:transcriptional regulator with XRE-family HTH domain
MSEYDFAERLRQARQRCGWSQTELGKRSGVHHMAISRLERGEKKDVTGGTLRKLALALGVSADWLLGIEDDESESLTAAVALASI